MSIGASMSSAWHNHPYIIMGVGGAIALYFLWPSSSSSAPSSSASSDYATQLAAETSLSQTQLASQAAVNENEQNMNAAENAAAEAAIGTSNEAIASANAAAIVSYNQTAQTQITGATNLGIAQSANQSSDFLALVAGLTTFGSQSETGLQSAGGSGLDAYLTGIGANFSSTDNGANITTDEFTNAPLGGGTYMSGSGTYGSGEGWGGGGVSGGGGQSSQFTNTQNDPTSNFSSLIDAASSPFTANDNLMAGLWGQLITQSGATSGALTAALPVSTVQLPTLSGPVQSIPAPIPV
jgi:hypothetical protein